MATTTTDDWTAAPYAEWLENCIAGIVECNPVCIAMAMIDADGYIDTCFYHAHTDEIAAIINAIEDEKRMQWVRDNKEDILTILNDEDDDVEDGDDGEADD